MNFRVDSAKRSLAPLYESPEIYDVAFGWDLTMELDFVESCLRKHAVEPVRKILEPACGTGRVLAGLGARGYQVAGYDSSPAMVAFASARLARLGGQIMRGDMAAFRPPGRHDAAINLVNSIGYLLEDEAVRCHLQRMGEVIPSGGVYLIQLSYGGEPPEQAAFGPWPNARAGIKTTLTWRVAREDREARRSYQECCIVVERGQERSVFEEAHVLRYWTEEDFGRLVDESPFEMVALYYDRFEEKPVGEKRSGSDGNLYHVLMRR